MTARFTAPITLRGRQGRFAPPPRTRQDAPTAATATGTARRVVTLRPTGRRSSYFLVLFAALVFLVLLGLVMVLSASAANALRYENSSWYFFKRHVMWLCVGAVALMVTLRVDYRFWQRLARPCFLVAVTMLTLVLIPRFGVSANGSTRWIGWGPITVQPAEVAKLALIVFIADLLARRHRWGVRLTVVPVLTVFAYVAFLLMLQPNLGTTIIVAAIVLTMLFASGAPLRSFAPITLGLAGCAGLLALAAPYRMRRLTGFRDLWANRGDTSYQTFQSLISVSNGGITGVGLGASRGKWGYLPYAHTDFIFSIIAEELGLIGALTVILVFVVIGVLGFAVAIHAPDRFGMLLALGITAWILVQAFMNIGVTLGVLPVTGVPLPFLSFGGSSLVVTLAGFGILLNVARHAR
jgi:cell division protein FtsW